MSLHQLAERLGETLKSYSKTMSTAESCTGGGIAKYITDIPGSSEWFDSGYVSYSNAAKQRMFGVRAETLAQFGAVSEQVVIEMVEGVVKVSGVDIGVAVSGVAGPGGGSDDKPVGTVWVAWHVNGVTETHRYLFFGNREEIRNLTIEAAMSGIIRRLSDEPCNIETES